MDTISFSKYHGCGNDFIIVEDLEGKYTELFKDAELVKRMCDRNFGIGADELLHITSDEKYDFVMDGYNAKYGVKSALCGNGSRCGIQFAKSNYIINKNEGTFLACDGPHQFTIEENRVNLNISDVAKSKIVQRNDDEFFLDIGSPHHVKFVHDIENYDVIGEGRKLRFSDRYNIPDSRGNTGVNVNYVELKSDDESRLRTYERAVEGETQACGTGSVSTAIAIAIKEGPTQDKKHKKVIVNNGGKLVISFTEDDDKFSNVILSGPAQKVFTGTFFVSK